MTLFKKNSHNKCLYFQSSSSSSSSSSLCIAVFRCCKTAARLDAISILVAGAGALPTLDIELAEDRVLFVEETDLRDPPFLSDPNPPVFRIAVIKSLRPLDEGGRFNLGISKDAGEPLGAAGGGGGGGGAVPPIIGGGGGDGGGGGAGAPVDGALGGRVLNEAIEGCCLMPRFGTGGGKGGAAAADLFAIGGIGGGGFLPDAVRLDGGGGGGGALLLLSVIINHISHSTHLQTHF